MVQELDIRQRRLLRRAERIAASGKRAAAEQLLREFVEEYPSLPQGWLKLAEVVKVEDEQAALYQHVLTLDPTNSAARAALSSTATPDAADAAATSPTVDEVDASLTFAAAADDVTVDQATVDAAETPAATELAATEPAAPGPDADAAENGGKPTFAEVAARLRAEAEARRQQEAEEQARKQAAFEAILPENRQNGQRKNSEPATHSHGDDEEIAGVRCYQCGDPLDVRQAIATPVGYVCATCKRELEKSYFTGGGFDYLVAAVVTLPVMVVLSILAGLIGFWFLAFFIGPAIGTLIGTLVFRMVRRRRSRYLAHVVAGTIVFASLIALLITSNFVMIGLLGAFAASSAFYRLRA